MASVHDAWRTSAAGRKLVLHVGGAHSALYVRYRSKDWYVVRASFDTSLAPDIDLNTVRLGDLPVATFDALWCSDMLEYRSRENALAWMQASYPLVKPGGEWGFAVPDMEALGTYIAARRGAEPLLNMPDGSKKTAMELAFGTDATPHLQGFTPDTLAQLLFTAGIGNASVTARALYIWVGSVVAAKDAGGARKIRIRRSAQAATPPAPPPIAKQPHPGQFSARMLPDELDIAPKRYDGDKQP